MMQRFTGPLENLWSMGRIEPIRRLTWDWWWWLIMLDADKVEGGRQLMVLWSTKDTENIDVDKVSWKQQGRPLLTEDASVIDGMVASWWWDGERMWEPIRLQTCRMAVVDETQGLWPKSAHRGGGAVVPILEQDLSMGLDSKASRFWLNMTSTCEGAPSEFKVEMTPWHPVLSTLRSVQKDYGKGMGYGIERIHGAKAEANIDGTLHRGTAYLQRVRVQAPAVPWYWGMLHFSDGSYLDWFLPHASLSMTCRDDRPWPLRHLNHAALSQSGLWHDAGRERSEVFKLCRVDLLPSEFEEGEHGHCPNAPLPRFEVELNNGRTRIILKARACARAHFRFDQPTRAGLISHLTYNEYPLLLEALEIKDEMGLRVLDDWDWIIGNAEHSWGLLH